MGFGPLQIWFLGPQKKKKKKRRVLLGEEATIRGEKKNGPGISLENVFSLGGEGEADPVVV